MIRSATGGFNLRPPPKKQNRLLLSRLLLFGLVRVVAAAPIKTWRAPLRPAFLSRRRLLACWHTAKVAAIFRDNAGEWIRPWAAAAAARVIFHHLRITLSACGKRVMRAAALLELPHAEKLGFLCADGFASFRMLPATCSPENLIRPDARFRSGAQLIHFSNCDRFWWKTLNWGGRLVTINFMLSAGKFYVVYSTNLKVNNTLFYTQKWKKNEEV